MPLSPPAPRTLKHVRRVNYQGFERDEGLWDIEGELHDSKAADQVFHGNRHVPAGTAIHHMWIRATVDTTLRVQAIEVAMDSHPLGHCPEATRSMQKMVGCCIARGWRRAIADNLGGVVGCTHLRELLFNLATAAFQSLPIAFAPASEDEPPRHLGQCTGWALDGKGVQEHYPRFYKNMSEMGL